MQHVNALQQPETLKILAFLEEIGISVAEAELPGPTFLPGLSLGPNCIRVDYSRLLYPGDLLHEAGHLAVATPEDREKAGTPGMQPGWPSDGEEIGAILWSYAALTCIGIAPEVVFHPNGYKKDSEWLIKSFREKSYIGLPFLEWIGLTLSEQKAKEQGRKAFPVMQKWLRTTG